MIKEIDKKDITECVDVIKESFLTVADEFGFEEAQKLSDNGVKSSIWYPLDTD